MSRVKRGVTSHAKHKKVYKAAKGFYGRRKNTIRAAKAAVDKAGQYAFRDRKRKKRTFRALWIQRINAAVRPFGMTYSVFINGLSKSGSPWTARCCRISPSPNRWRSRRSPKRPRPRSRRKPSDRCLTSDNSGVMPRESGASSNHRPTSSTPGVTGSSAFADDDGLVLPDRKLRSQKVAVAMTDLAQLESQILSDVAAASDEAALEAVRVAALGKKGSISALLSTLGKMSPDERKTQGAAINLAKDKVSLRRSPRAATS